MPLDGTFWRRPLVADFEGVRAVYLHWNASYLNLAQNIVEHKDGELKLESLSHTWAATGDGVLLLLLAPLYESHSPKAEAIARGKVGLVRSMIVALLGRNAAFKQEFEISVLCEKKEVGTVSPTFATPTAQVPTVNKEGLQLVDAALHHTSSLEETMKNRIHLALRWFQRSFGENRIVRDIEEGTTDNFINCWLALETLAMESSNIQPIKKMLSEIHGLDAQTLGELFPIGRVYNVRNDIVHGGRITGLDKELVEFMGNVFIDILLHMLDLPSGKNTEQYLDGSAKALV